MPLSLPLLFSYSLSLIPSIQAVTCACPLARLTSTDLTLHHLNTHSLFSSRGWLVFHCHFWVPAHPSLCHLSEAPSPCRPLAQARRRKKAFNPFFTYCRCPLFIIIYCYLPRCLCAVFSVLFLIPRTCLARRLTPYQFASLSRLLIRASRLAVHSTDAAKRTRLRRPEFLPRAAFLETRTSKHRIHQQQNTDTPFTTYLQVQPADPRSRLFTFRLPCTCGAVLSSRRTSVFNNSNPIPSHPSDPACPFLH